MSQGMNDLLVGLSDSFCAEDMMLAGLEASICSEIISQRIKRNMTQKEFAEFMGVSQGLVSKWEKGECNFTLSSLVRIASKLGLRMQSPLPPSEPHYTDSPCITLLPIKWNTISTGSSKYRSSELKEM